MMTSFVGNNAPVQASQLIAYTDDGRYAVTYDWHEETTTPNLFLSIKNLDTVNDPATTASAWSFDQYTYFLGWLDQSSSWADITDINGNTKKFGASTTVTNKKIFAGSFQNFLITPLDPYVDATMLTETITVTLWNTDAYYTSWTMSAPYAVVHGSNTVPVPNAVWLLGSGLAALGALSRRKKQPVCG